MVDIRPTAGYFRDVKNPIEKKGEKQTAIATSDLALLRVRTLEEREIQNEHNNSLRGSTGRVRNPVEIHPCRTRFRTYHNDIVENEKAQARDHNV